MKTLTSALLAAILAIPGFGQSSATPSAAVKPLTIQANQSDVREVLRDLATKSGGKILIGTEVTGKLTLNVASLTLDQAVNLVAKMASLRCARLVLPADKADTLTADQASGLVAAAESLASSGVLSVQPAPAACVAVAPPAATPTGATVVYLVQTKVDPAAIKAARDEARKRAADKNETAQEKALAATLSSEAAKDSTVVKAYSAVHSLQPDQIAVLMREFMSHSTPQQLQQIGEAIQRHNVPLDGSQPQ